MHGLPDVTAQRAGQGTLELEFTLDAACPWLEGHFPGRPILPGVVQVGWAADFARALAGHDDPPAQLERIKFKRPILPGARLRLRLAREAGKVRYEYLLLEGGQALSASSGVFGYLDAP